MSDKRKPTKPFTRRNFIQTAAMTAAALGLPGCSRTTTWRARHVRRATITGVARG